MPSSAVSASWRRCRRLLAIVLLCAVAGLAQAQVADADDQADPPGRVARLSYIAGDLGLLPAGAEDWSDASVNRPLTTGDRLSSGQNARAELEFGGGTLRIDGQTNVGLLDLDDELAQVELTRGTLNLAVRNLDEGQSYEIDTPTVALVVDRPGKFRVDIGDNDTRITAFSGSATVYGENNAQRTINPGRSYRFTDSGLGMVAITDIGGGDAFDNWAAERDRRYAQSDSSQYVSDDVVGYQDLDQYGDWQNTSEYGNVWFPNRVAADWAPYRDGHWAYIAPWGWTWVDDSPWGFAPYHYGRWAYLGSRWGWIPGPRGMRSVYAPALVAFVGGGNWSVGIGGAPVGWFPLGPGDIYNPWYRCGRSYYTRVNIRNLRERRGHDHRRDIAHHYDRYRRGRPGRGDHYANRGAHRGFTAVPGHSFTGGRHVQRDRMRIDPRKLVDAPVMSRGIDKLRPGRGGARPSRNAHVRSLPVGGFNREVVARHAPPVRGLGARRIGQHGKVTGPVRDVVLRSRVRVLNSHDNHDRAARSSQAGRNHVAGNDSRQPNTAPRQLPRVPRIRTATMPGKPSTSTDRTEARELRSARFAHPGNRDHAARPRPGASFIGNARENASRSTAATLPQVPRFQRDNSRGAVSSSATRHASERRPARSVSRHASERTSPSRTVSRHASERTSPSRTVSRPNVPVRRADMSRYRQAASPPRNGAREAPRAISQRAPVARPSPQPRQRAQPTQRSAPAQRVRSTPARPRSESRPAARSSADRGSKERWKH